MAAYKCKMCGGDLTLVEGETVAECEYCGSRQTVPTADNEKKMTLFGRANRLRLGCEFDKAAGVYESIVAEFPEEAEAYWGLVLCRYGIEYVDDPATGKKIPTCHRSSFDSVMEDSDFEQACENADGVSRRLYRDEAKQIEELRKGILEVSGKEEPYDIFICYKETDENGNRTLDSVLAQDVYDALTGKGYRVFFSRITLEDKLGQEYEPYIFAALNSAKVMLAFGTDYEYYNAVWVKNEWSRFLKLMAADKDKYLIPCYKGIDAYDMPKEFSRLQAQDMGKVGAVQDLLRGVGKLLHKEEAKTVTKETVVVQQTSGTNGDALLKRGYMALEDRECKKADEFFEEVLNQDAENGRAYLGKFLAEHWSVSLEELKKKELEDKRYLEKENLIPWSRNQQFEQSLMDTYAFPGYLERDTIQKLCEFDFRYESIQKAEQKNLEENRQWLEGNRNYQRAKQYGDAEQRQELECFETELIHVLEERLSAAREQDEQTAERLKEQYTTKLESAERKAQELWAEADARAAADRENFYQSWVNKMQTAKTVEDYQQIEVQLRTMGNYKDAEAFAQACDQKIEEIQEAEKRRKEEQARLEAARKEAAAAKRKKITIITVIAAILSAAAMMVTMEFVIPSMKYNKAVGMTESGDLYQAALLFSQIGEFKDASEQSRQLWSQVADRSSLSSGNYHVAGIKTDGTVVVTGRKQSKATRVEDWTDIVTVDAAEAHTIGLKSNGTVVATGNNNIGQCDVNDWTNVVAISAGVWHTVGLKLDGTVMAVGGNVDGQCNIAEWTDIIAIDAGYYQTTGLKVDGTVVAVGDNTHGQCGVTDWSEIVAISAGMWHTSGLKSDGTVVAVGDNAHGQCDVSDWSDIAAISTGAHHTVGLKSDGTVVAAGNNAEGQCDVSGWSDIVAISAGHDHTIGLKSDGTVVFAGKTSDGIQKVLSWTDIKVPQQ